MERLFKRFHLMIFFIFVVGCLAGAVILVSETLSSSADTSDYSSTINAGTIDQTTLNRIQSLHTSNQPGDAPALPEGRINPFAE